MAKGRPVKIKRIRTIMRKEANKKCDKICVHGIYNYLPQIRTKDNARMI